MYENIMECCACWSQIRRQKSFWFEINIFFDNVMMIVSMSIFGMNYVNNICQFTINELYTEGLTLCSHYNGLM